MYRIEYHTQEQLGTDEQTDAYFDTLTPEEIQKIKEKYKYGIPDGEIKRWILEKE